MTASEARRKMPRVSVRLPDGTVEWGSTLAGSEGTRGNGRVLIRDWENPSQCIRLRVSWARIARAVTAGSPINILRGDRA